MAMEDNKENKRAREESEDSESEANSVPNLKLARVDSENMALNSPVATQVEPDPDDGDIQSPEAKRIQEDLLNILDDFDAVNGPGLEIQGLELVIKSFEEEILVPTQAPVAVMASDPGESRPELGFLLDDSEDELGLPPSFSSVEEQIFGTFDVKEGGVGSGAAGFGETMGYEFPIPSYGSFEFAVVGDSDTNIDSHSKNGDFVALAGLFEPAADISELTWRSESLSAL